MGNEILLLGKKIFWDRSEILLDYQPDENWQNIWDAKLGHWECKDGYLIGSEPGQVPTLIGNKAKQFMPRGGNSFAQRGGYDFCF